VSKQDGEQVVNRSCGGKVVKASRRTTDYTRNASASRNGSVAITDAA